MWRSPLWCAVALAGLASCGVADAQIPQSERDALIALYTSTGGPNWKNSSGWNGPPGTECTWFGVGCDSTSSTVTGIQLISNGLAGPLPPLTALKSLQGVNFRFNGLTGQIPPFTGLTQLQSFDFGDNQFGGQVPSLQGLTALHDFSMEFDSLEGPLPSFDNLPALVYVNLQYNSLSGPIPSLTGMPLLQDFGVAANHLSGHIPDLSGFHDLVDFDVSFNNLDGPIPSLDGLANLDAFHASLNQLSGPFPSMKGLSKLTTFQVVGNQLSGTLPASLDDSPLLDTFWVAENQIGGTLPPLSALTKLTSFQADANELTGSIPSLDGLVLLEDFKVSDNRLQGHLPTLAGHPVLNRFEAYRNQLDGQIPPLTGLGKLEMFAVFSNNLDGPIPSLSDVTALKAFDVSDNQLSGQIPALTGLSALFDFRVQTNQLEGPLPALAGLSALLYFHVEQNRLTDALPPSLSGATSLVEFRAFSNQLSGTIPPLAALTALSVFDVAGNRLTGALPSLSGLGNLTRFRVGDNQLSGTLPPVPSPNHLGDYNSSLCPNTLTPRDDPAWDAATGAAPWYDTCTIDQSSNGAPTNQDSTQVVLSQDGKIRVFQSLQTNLTANTGNAGGQDIYSTTADGDPVLESIDSSGNKLVGMAGLPAVSPDGKVVAFLFAPGAKSRKDFISGQMWTGGRGQPKHQVDIGMGGVAANGAAASAPSLSSANGTNQLVFCSAASNLVSDDANGGRDIFLADPLNAAAAITRISVDGSGKELPGDSCEPRLSSDGTKLVFSLSAAPLFGTAARQIVLKELTAGKVFITGQIQPITANSTGQGASADSSEPVISTDGSVVAFTSTADLDGLGAPVGNREVYFSLKLPGGRLLKRARSGDGTVPDGASQHPQVSDDGTAVVLQTAATNFLAPKSKAAGSAAPVQCGVVAITSNFLSVNALGSPLCASDGRTSNQNPSISGDGTTAGFDSNAPQANGNTNRNAYAQGLGTYNGLINATKLPNLSGDYSGQWFDPTQSGQGIVVDVYQPDANNNRIVAVTWFVYVDGHPTWVQGSAIAHAGSDDAANTVVVQMDQVAIFTGTSFPLGAAHANPVLWGSITLTFTDANNGTMSWRSKYPGFNSGSMPLVHFLAVGLQSQDASSAQVKSCYSGNWFNPAQSGHGFEFEVLPASPNAFLSVDWFAFGPDGAPVWLEGVGSIVGNSAQMHLQLIDGSGAQFPPAFIPSATTAHDWGSATFTFTDATHGSVSWNSSIAGYGTGTQPLQPTFAALGLSLDRRACQ